MDSLWERRQATRQRLDGNPSPAGTTHDLESTEDTRNNGNNGNVEDVGGTGARGSTVHNPVRNPVHNTVHLGTPPPTAESDPTGHVAAVVDCLTRTLALEQELDVLLSPSPDAPRTRVTKSSGSTEIHVRLVAEETPGVTSVAADLANALRGLR